MKYEKRNDLITILASSCVIISFFLPWVGRLTGPNIVSYSIKAFDMSNWSNEWIIIGIFGLLFALSPIVFHVLNLITIVSGRSRKLCLTCVSLPFLIWVALFVVAALQIGELPILEGGSYKIGFIATIMGQIIALIHQSVSFNTRSV